MSMTKCDMESYLEEGLDTCQFDYEGDKYIAVIETVGEDFMIVQPYKKNYESNLDGNRMHKIYFPRKCFDAINLEIWMDNRGCDNSAMGYNGCYEPYTIFFN